MNYALFATQPKIKSDHDDEPPLITGNTSVAIKVTRRSDNTNVISKLWALVMDKVTDVMEYVMDETIDGDEFDGCDGIFQNSSKIENKVNTEIDCKTNNQKHKGHSCVPMQQKQERQQELSKMPSPKAKIAMTVGDRVTVDDCPGHWSWASPFTVEAVDGDLVKLEMVRELVEIER